MNIHPPKSVFSTMMWVYAMALPALIGLTLWQGHRFLSQLAISSVAALFFEACLLTCRGKPLKPFLTDGSALITAMLLCIAIPALAPYWVTVTGIFFAIVIGKHLYGGLGHTIFNPAMVGYAVLLCAFPQYLSVWELGFDGISQATPLDLHQSGQTLQPFTWPAYAPMLWINIAWLAGGLVLVIKKIVDWRLPLGFLCGALMISLIAQTQTASLPFSTDFFLGATLVGAFFIVSDPVTACTTPQGRLIYAFLAGSLTLIIRHWASFPDGLAFAILLSNAAAPLIDHLIVSKPWK